MSGQELPVQTGSTGDSVPNVTTRAAPEYSAEAEAAARVICISVGQDPDALGPVTKIPAWRWLLMQAATLYPKLLCGTRCVSPRSCGSAGYCLGNF